MRKRVIHNSGAKHVITILTDKHGIKFVGRAKCDPQDNFDLEKGKKISFFRARSKKYSKNIKDLKFDLAYIDKVRNETLKSINYYQTKLENNEEQLKQYLENNC